MDYKQTLDYLFSQLPMFQRVGAAAYKADLDNTIAICRLLGNPENKFRSIHVAGTNGKGSTSHMLASILRENGLKVGLYTSPHLKDFRERIRINGEMIPESNVVDFVAKYKTDFEKIQPSFFEMTVGLAFLYFAEEKVDIAIIEVGLGGRLDSTNVITPLVSVITNISYDHTALLGDSLEKIATEKAGIIKRNVPVVIGEVIPETRKVFTGKAEKENAEMYFAEELFDVQKIYQENELLKLEIIRKENSVIHIESPLLGAYQRKNIVTVLSVMEVLKKRGISIPDTVIHKGLRNVILNTGLAGRWQILRKDPLVVADTGHNEAGMSEVLQQIKKLSYQKLHFVLGMVNDKDISKILSMLPVEAEYYFCRAKIPRALDAEELSVQARNKGLQGTVYPSVPSALEAAIQMAHKDDLVFVGGSTFTVAEIV